LRFCSDYHVIYMPTKYFWESFSPIVLKLRDNLYNLLGTYVITV